MPIGCTGWLTSTGAVLTAGYCATAQRLPRLKTMEFNVPVSQPDGTIQRAQPKDQYPIDSASFISNTGDGNDWATRAKQRRLVLVQAKFSLEQAPFV